MMNSAFTADDIREALIQIDEEATIEFGRKVHFEMIIVGGSVLLLSQLSKRAITRDIDALSYDGALEDIVARHLEINSQAKAYADRPPKGFTRRLVMLPIETQVVTFLRPSNEDLAVMKLYSWRRQDQDDLLSAQMLRTLNRTTLEKLIYDENEARASCNAASVYRQMVETYERRFLARAAKAAKRNGTKQWLKE